MNLIAGVELENPAYRVARYLAEHDMPVVPLHEPSAAGIRSCVKRGTCRGTGKDPRTRHGLHDTSSELVMVAQLHCRQTSASLGR